MSEVTEVIAKFSYQGSMRRASLQEHSFDGLRTVLVDLYSHSRFTITWDNVTVTPEADVAALIVRAKASAKAQPVVIKFLLSALPATAAAPTPAPSAAPARAPLWHEHPKLGLYSGNHTREVYAQRHKTMLRERGPVGPLTGHVPVVGTQAEDDWELLSKQDEFREKKKLEVPPALLAAYVANSVSFTVNGKQVTVDSASVDPHTFLADYLRFTLGLTGTKIGCGEGGCGACTVLIIRGGKPTLANACLRPVFSLDGASVLTTEGIGTSDAPNPIQSKIAECDGTQCGYCTPGMVMSMYGLLAKGGSPSLATIEAQFQGNLCRCTGYRPIYTAMHSFAKTESENADVLASIAKNTAPNTPTLAKRSFMASDDALWFNPTSVSDVFGLLNTYHGQPLRLVVGNTSTGVIKYYPPDPNDDPTVFINIAQLAELTAIDTSNTASVTFGAAVTIADVLKTMEGLISLYPSKTSNLVPVARHLHKVAHPQVREVGSWAGNVCMARTHPDFPSDVVLVLATCGAIIRTMDREGKLTDHDVLDFMAAPADPTVIVFNVNVPFNNDPMRILDTFKVMQRHANSHPLVNAGFHLVFSGGNGKFTIVNARIVIGNITRGPLLCKTTADALKGQVLSLDLLNSIMPVLQKEATPTPCPVADPDFVPGDPAYRQSLALSLFYKYVLGCMVKLLGASSVDPKLVSATTYYERPVSSGKQSYPEGPPGEAPLGQPVHKLEGLMQATGQVQYTSEVFRPPNTVFGAGVLATKQGVIVTAIDPSAALAIKGVVGFVSAKDIKDMGVANSCGGYEVFVSGTVSWIGQFVGLVVASSSAIAQRAAKLVEVTYSSFSLVANANKAAAPYGPNDTPAVFERRTPHNGVTVVAPATVTGKLATTGQRHFYLETQAALAAFTGDLLTVEHATQSLTLVRSSLATMLGTKEANVIVSNTRSGGAYGGKSLQSPFIAAVATIAAKKLKLPVLVQFDRNTDMLAMGARPPCSAEFSATYDTATYKLAGMEINVIVDAGSDTTAGFFPCTNINAYIVPNAKLNSTPLKTCTPINTIMRAPGEFQGTLFTETAVEAVVFATGNTGTMGQVKVQEANFDPSMMTVWNAMKAQVDLSKMDASVAAFNSVNKWRKRGWYCMPVMYHLNSADTVERLYLTVHEDGSIVVNHSGLECGQGINTKVVQAIASGLSKTAKVDMGLITTVVDKSSTQFPGVSPTWASTTSEAVVFACMKATSELNTRLAKHVTPGATWEQVITAAVAAKVNLAVVNDFAGPDAANYLINCACVTQVELDVLTGENNVLSTDIFYDAGTSMNPVVDIGQIEGCFLQSLGFCLTEEQVHNWTTGRLVSNGTWEYKIPCSLDIPINMNVTLIPGENKCKNNVMGSKAVGEPGYMLGISCLFALKNAIYASRKERGITSYFQLDCPASPERTALACAVAFPPSK